MKKRKSHLVFIPAVGITTFMFSQWLINSKKADLLFGFSADAVAGVVVGLGIGVMIVLLRRAIATHNHHCK